MEDLSWSCLSGSVGRGVQPLDVTVQVYSTVGQGVQSLDVTVQVYSTVGQGVH